MSSQQFNTEASETGFFSVVTEGQSYRNTGYLLLGLPLGWVILSTGMWNKTSSINAPLYSFEISQSGYGLYVKYLMVGFLAVYGVTMIIQFSSYLLDKVADLRQEPGGDQLTAKS